VSRNLAAELRAAQANTGVAAAPTADDRLAELCLRHWQGEYEQRPSVQRRLDELFAAPLDQLDQTTDLLLRACDFLGVTGHDLLSLRP